jgi:hypothetical protein
MSYRHFRHAYHGYGTGVMLPDYRVIANEAVGSFHRIWDTGDRSISGATLFGTELVDFVPEDFTYGAERHSMENANPDNHMYYDTGEHCPYVGCQHGWRVAGRSAQHVVAS